MAEYDQVGGLVGTGVLPRIATIAAVCHRVVRISEQTERIGTGRPRLRGVVVRPGTIARAKLQRRQGKCW